MKRLAILFLAVAFLSSSCATQLIMTVPPVTLAQPVSMSSMLPDKTGAVVDGSSYVIVDEFEFTKTWTGEQNVKNTFPLDLDTELEPILAASGADAIVDLRIIPVSKSMGNTIGSGLLWTGTIWGGMLGVAMAIMAGMWEANEEDSDSYYFPRDPPEDNPYLLARDISLILGVATGAAGYALRLYDKPNLVVKVSGKAVKFKD